MALDERARHELHQKLEQTLGSDAAATLMGHLPPVGWADVATKRDLDELRRDLDNLEARLEAKMEALEHRAIATIRGELMTQTRTFVFAMSGSILTTAALAFAAARLV